MSNNRQISISTLLTNTWWFVSGAWPKILGISVILALHTWRASPPLPLPSPSLPSPSLGRDAINHTNISRQTSATSLEVCDPHCSTTWWEYWNSHRTDRAQYSYYHNIACNTQPWKSMDAINGRQCSCCQACPGTCLKNKVVVFLPRQFSHPTLSYVLLS